jgi:TRAP-type C4-dicarboxylate transport system permease small subunit
MLQTPSLYSRFAAVVTTATQVAVILVVTLMCVLVLAQVVTRYVLSDTPAFLSELATYCLIWTGTLGSSLAFRYRKHVAMDLLSGRLSASKQRSLATINVVLLVAFLAVFFYSSLLFALDMREQSSATMDFSMTYPALGLAVGTALMIVQVIDAWLNPELVEPQHGRAEEAAKELVQPC